MSGQERAHLGVLSIQFHIPNGQSLKEKRAVIKSVKDRIRNEFNVSVAEIGLKDQWQECVLGICAINTDKPYLDGVLQNILSFLSSIDRIVLREHQIDFL